MMLFLFISIIPIDCSSFAHNPSFKPVIVYLSLIASLFLIFEVFFLIIGRKEMFSNWNNCDLWQCFKCLSAVHEPKFFMAT